MRNSQIVSSTTEELSKHPTLVISLDFEKGWGLNNTDPKKIEQKIFNLRLEDKVVSRILTAAAINDIAITWATVGAIGLKNTTDFKAYCDDVSYKDIRYFDIPFDLIEKNQKCFFDSDSISKIVQSKNQELAIHSFHHGFYKHYWDRDRQLQRELQSTKKIFSNFIKIDKLKTYVYPRNDEYCLPILNLEKITHVRLKNKNLLSNCLERIVPKKVLNTVRFIKEITDAEAHSYIKKQDDLKQSNGDIFVRFNLPDVLWRKQLDTMVRALRNLRNNQILHLWWHPSNLLPFDEVKVKRVDILFELLARELQATGTKSECLGNL